MINPQLFQNVLHRFVQRVASTSAGAWLLSRILPTLDRIIFRLSRRTVTATSVISGLPVIVLTTLGVKSKQPRAVPLVAIPDGQNIIVVASNWGQTHHPMWYRNLLAHSEAAVLLNGYVQSHIAREAQGEERQVYWRKAIEMYAGYAAYERRAQGRRIPIMILTPNGEKVYVG